LQKTPTTLKNKGIPRRFWSVIEYIRLRSPNQENFAQEQEIRLAGRWLAKADPLKGEVSPASALAASEAGPKAD
jgi:hypothetical protein